jgi:transposase
MTITNQKIESAENEIRWIRQYASGGDPYQQKVAMRALLDIIKILADRIDTLEQKIENLQTK